MADASPELIQRLIENSKNVLAQMEVSFPQIMKTRQAVDDEIKKQCGNNVVLNLLLVALDTMLAENEVIYDLSSLLNALLKADNNYTKRYYMQSLNLCFWESCQLFVGEDGDEQGLLSKIEDLTKQLNQAGCQFISRHIIDDIKEFREEYSDRELRNITRHFDDPIAMYEKIQGLTNVDFFAKGASQLMAICMEVMVVSSFLMTLLSPVKNGPQNVLSSAKKSISEIENDAIFKVFKEKGIKMEVQRVLERGLSSLDECYKLHRMFRSGNSLLKERDVQIPKSFLKLESVIRLRMEALFLRNDVACSIWGYLNSSSDMERSQNLKQIYITKQAALTHIYGYNKIAREKSLWARIKDIEEYSNEKLNAAEIEKCMEQLSRNLSEDSSKSNVYAHYRHNQNFYIPNRLEALGKMHHHKELYDAMKLFNICKVLEGFTYGLICCIYEEQKQKTKWLYDEWMGMVDILASKLGRDGKANET